MSLPQGAVNWSVLRIILFIFLVLFLPAGAGEKDKDNEKEKEDQRYDVDRLQSDVAARQARAFQIKL